MLVHLELEAFAGLTGSCLSGMTMLTRLKLAAAAETSSLQPLMFAAALRRLVQLRALEIGAAALSTGNGGARVHPNCRMHNKRCLKRWPKVLHHWCLTRH